MIDAGILDGDFMVARSQTDRRQRRDRRRRHPGRRGDGQDLLTRTGDQVVLLPSNPRLEPMEFDPDEVAVFGKVVTVMRKL